MPPKPVAAGDAAPLLADNPTATPATSSAPYRLVSTSAGSSQPAPSPSTLDSLVILGPNTRAKPYVPSRSGVASSGYRGVSSQGQRWRARICVDKLEYTIGDFNTEEQAALAYDREAIKKGKLKNLNFIYRGVNEHLFTAGSGGSSGSSSSSSSGGGSSSSNGMSRSSTPAGALSSSSSLGHGGGAADSGFRVSQVDGRRSTRPVHL
jgi:uncharacterized membrane protein YgcG